MQISGKTFLVTGASSGLAGKATAKKSKLSADLATALFPLRLAGSLDGYKANAQTRKRTSKRFSCPLWSCRWEEGVRGGNPSCIYCYFILQTRKKSSHFLVHKLKEVEFVAFSLACDNLDHVASPVHAGVVSTRDLHAKPQCSVLV